MFVAAVAFKMCFTDLMKKKHTFRWAGAKTIVLAFGQFSLSSYNILILTPSRRLKISISGKTPEKL